MGVLGKGFVHVGAIGKGFECGSELPRGPGRVRPSQEQSAGRQLLLEGSAKKALGKGFAHRGSLGKGFVRVGLLGKGFVHVGALGKGFVSCGSCW